jgi:hypothetical protein
MRRDTLYALLQAVCNHRQVPLEKVMSGTRKQECVRVRQEYCYIASIHKTYFTLNEIAEVIGKDHSTAVHSIGKVKGFSEVNPNYANELNELINSIPSVESAEIKIVNVVQAAKIDRAKELERELAHLNKIISEKDTLIIEQMRVIEADRKEIESLRNFYNNNYKKQAS